MDKPAMPMGDWNPNHPSTEKEAVAWLEEMRWSGNPKCPRCESANPIKRKGKRLGQYRCKSCQQEFNVRTGTLFQGTHLPLTAWLDAIHFALDESRRMSSIKLAARLHTSQLTARSLAKRLRQACRSDDQLLKEIIEADQTYVGGFDRAKRRLA